MCDLMLSCAVSISVAYIIRFPDLWSRFHVSASLIINSPWLALRAPILGDHSSVLFHSAIFHKSNVPCLLCNSRSIVIFISSTLLLWIASSHRSAELSFRQSTTRLKDHSVYVQSKNFRWILD